MSRVYTLSLLCYLVAFGLSFVVPVAALAICLGLALYYALPTGAGPQVAGD